MDAAPSIDTGALAQPPKRKRGRPPKNPEAAAAAAAAKQASAAQQDAQQELALQPAKRRGRPPGSRNRLCKAQGNPMVPQVVMVAGGEDVFKKLRDLSGAYRRSLVVLAASGLLSAATLMQLDEGGQGTGVTLEGSFTILSISGALLQSVEPKAASARRDPSTQFLSASLANPAGGVVGGMVAGPLLAAGPVMVVIGHWEPNEHQQAGTCSDDAAAAAPGSAAGDAAGPPAAAAGDDDGEDVANGDDAALLQQLGGVDLAAAAASAAASAAAAAAGEGAGEGAGLLGLPVQQLQGLLSAASAETESVTADEGRSGALAQADPGWCGGLGVGGQADSIEQHIDEEEQQHGQDRDGGDD